MSTPNKTTTEPASAPFHQFNVKIMRHSLTREASDDLFFKSFADEPITTVTLDTDALTMVADELELEPEHNIDTFKSFFRGQFRKKSKPPEGLPPNFATR